ncbi:uncharacterized protein LOC108039143 [Drosophila rhopaloa]|uniref:Uncharacterized protein LOC108039143 n=1 Tax=Drosophila rhopaloa TaxID=1041015 RepID=A0A6P4EDY6_DRORH|nr:uncharacterized protein LOC108039143 [Drosophila rhopaloa]
MEQQTLKRLTQARGRLKATVTHLVNYIENPPPQNTYSGVDDTLARLNQAFRSLEEITDEMHVYDNVEGFEDPTEDFQAYEEKRPSAKRHTSSGSQPELPNWIFSRQNWLF